ncbi:MAG: hypothetical protein FWD74_11355 [Actinomycetia bacterium]|nr:hypothetical protein [Actinomycetes bacterium]
MDQSAASARKLTEPYLVVLITERYDSSPNDMRVLKYSGGRLTDQSMTRLGTIVVAYYWACHSQKYHYVGPGGGGGGSEVTLLQYCAALYFYDGAATEPSQALTTISDLRGAPFPENGSGYDGSVPDRDILAEAEGRGGSTAGPTAPAADIYLAGHARAVRVAADGALSVIAGNVGFGPLVPAPATDSPVDVLAIAAQPN